MSQTDHGFSFTATAALTVMVTSGHGETSTIITADNKAPKQPAAFEKVAQQETTERHAMGGTANERCSGP